MTPRNHVPRSLLLVRARLKVGMTATIVVVVSVTAERSGPFIAALIAAGAIGSMAANAAVAIFALTYAALAQRHGVVLSLAVATFVWFAITAALRLVEWTPAATLVLNAIVLERRRCRHEGSRHLLRRLRRHPPTTGGRFTTPG
jgi:hypothetical protein